jgi:hypothetical protein
MIKKVLILLTLCILFSCYIPPKTVLNFYSRDENVIWLQGKELIKKNNDNIEIIINFNRSKQQLVSFDLAINNTSSAVIDIEPTAIFCTFADEFDKELKLNRNIIDPEEQLYRYDSMIESKNAGIASYNANQMIFDLFDVAATISGADKNLTRSEKEEKYRKKEEQERHDDRHEKKQKSDLSDYSSKRNTWANSTLRKTTLLPGQQINGKIFFHLSRHIKELTITIPYENENIDIEFYRKDYKKKKKAEKTDA